MRRLRRAQRQRGPDGSHRGVRGGGPAQHQGRTETVPAPKTARLAGAARVVVCGIHQQQRCRQTLPLKMAAGLSRKPRETERGGLIDLWQLVAIFPFKVALWHTVWLVVD